MKHSDELKRLEEDLKGSEVLAKNLDEACKRIASEGQAESDGEVMVAAAKELGYDISIAALEQARAAAEELDPEALMSVAGGIDNGDHKGWCDDNNFNCFTNYHQHIEDEDDHDGWCLTAWHCFATTLHTGQKDQDVSCWSDSTCVAFNH